MVAETTYRKLTLKEDWFARLVAQGRTLASAYREAYESTSKNAKINAHKISRRPAVAARIAELSKQDEKRLFLTRARKRELLLQFAENTRASVLERQRAIVIDNRMTGDDRQIVSVEGEITLVSVMAALAGSAPLPAEDEIIDLPPSSPINANTGPQQPDGSRPDVAGEDPAGAASESPLAIAESASGAAQPQKRTPGPFDEEFEAFTVPEEKPPQKRRTRVYPA